MGRKLSSSVGGDDGFYLQKGAQVCLGPWEPRNVDQNKRINHAAELARKHVCQSSFGRLVYECDMVYGIFPE